MATSSSKFAVILILSVFFFLVNNPLKCEAAGNVLYNVGAMYRVESLQYNTTQLNNTTQVNLTVTEQCVLVMPPEPIRTGAPFCNLTLENNGELVFYGPLGARLWSSNVSGSSGEYVVVLNSTQLGVYGPRKWATNTTLGTLNPTDVDMRAENVLFPEQTLENGTSLKNGRWELKMRLDCNLVLYNLTWNKEEIWSSNTSKDGDVACHLKMESTGDAVIYDNESGDQVWSSNTSGIGISVLVLRNDGNLVIYGPVIWETPPPKKERKHSALGRPFIKMV